MVEWPQYALEAYREPGGLQVELGLFGRLLGEVVDAGGSHSAGLAPGEDRRHVGVVAGTAGGDHGNRHGFAHAPGQLDVVAFHRAVAIDRGQALYDYRRTSGETYFKPAAYAVSKSALYNLTRYLAVYWGRAGVRVNTVTFAGVANNQDPRFVERYLPKVPLGRMAAPTDYNGTVIYLLSDASSYMTGANVVVDGGFTAL